MQLSAFIAAYESASPAQQRKAFDCLTKPRAATVGSAENLEALKVVSVREASELLGYSSRTLRRLATDGTLTPIGAQGRAHGYTVKSVKAYLAAQEERAEAIRRERAAAKANAPEVEVC